MTQPDWASIIEVLYRRNGTVEFPEHDDNFHPDNPLISNTNLTQSQIREVTEYLNDLDLIEYEYRSHEYVTGHVQKNRTAISLTPEGFSVAHERELRNRQQELIDKQTQATHVVAALTVVLALSAATQVIIGFQSLNLVYKSFVGVVALAAVIIVVWLLYRVDII